MTKVNKLYQSDHCIGGDFGSETEKTMYEAAVAAMGEEKVNDPWFHMLGALVPTILGIEYASIGQVGYAEGCGLLYMVQRDIYNTPNGADDWDREFGRIGALRMNCDDFQAYKDASGKAVLYRHFVHGDCGETWFTVSE